jgi:dipeptidyl aminopeptidase/acylaminoacyl peptidase
MLAAMKWAAAVACVVACGGADHPATPATDMAEARATAAVDAFTNSSPLVTPDGHVVFLSNRDGVAMLYVGDVAHPAEPPRLLPTKKQRIASPALVPDGKTIVFLADTGSNQIFHVYSIGIDGTGYVDLTPSDAYRRESLVVARTSGALFYVGHTLKDETSHVIMRTPDGQEREVYKDPRPGGILDVTADGSRLLFLSYASDTVHFLMEVDTARAAAMGGEWTKPDATLSTATFSADGKSVITVVERRGQPATIERRERDGKVLATYDETTAPNATALSITASPKGDRLVVMLDAGNHFELRELDATTLQPVPLPNLPLASYEVDSFTLDGSMVTLTERGTAGPADIVALDIATGTLKPLRDEPRKGIGSPPRATIETLRTFDGRTMPVNLYVPPGPSARHPVVVSVHGGPSGSAIIAWSPTIAFWTAMGFVVVAPNIRGSTGFGLEYQAADDREHRADALHDMETLNTWIRAQPWCDPNRIVIAGGSYGGYMTLLALARQPTLWAAGIDVSGMSNLVTMEQMEDQAIRQFDDTEFGKLGADDALLREWSPITYVDQIVRPLFVYQGVNDPVTPQHEADQIVEAVKKRNVPVEYMLLPDEGHGINRRENTIQYLVRSYRFVTSHMR